jgi:hypothetical protein
VYGGAPAKAAGIVWAVETGLHIALKEAARAFLLERGARAVGVEVRCPLNRRRVDAAGYFPRSPRHSEAESAQVGLFTNTEAGLSERDASREAGNAWTGEQRRARTVIIECKASREDFLRDCAQREALEKEAEALRVRRERIEAMLRRRAAPGAEPKERLLFADLEEWDYSACVSPARQKVGGELALVERKLRAETKFEEMARYRLADCLLIAAPRGELKKTDLPAGWGLAECPAGALRAWVAARKKGEPCAPPDLAVILRPPALDATPLWRERLLRHIAYALTRG